MDLQTYCDNAVAAARKETLDQSDQLTLGELIIKLENISLTYTNYQDRELDKEVVFDFEYLFPTYFDSWRGSYKELSLCFSQRDYKNQPMPASKFLAMCKSTIGSTFTGYKGGDFVMGKTTPVWVANTGNSGMTALIDIIDNDYQVILVTGIRQL